MLDQSINPKSLEFAISPNEWIKYPDKFINGDSAVIDDCMTFYQSGRGFPLLTSKPLYGNPIYTIDDITSDIFLRRLNLTLKTINSARQNDRSNIIKSIVSLLPDKRPYSVLRLDITKFYESIDLDFIVNKICTDSAYSSSTRDLLTKWADCFKNSRVQGLPRGLSISSTLSEYFMRPFDKGVRNIGSVFYYARFVDDIIIFTTENPETLLAEVEKLLPRCLTFSRKPGKKQKLPVSEWHKKSTQTYELDFLGYHFKLADSKGGRDLKIDLSESKKKKIKTRIVKSLLSFSKTSDFILLEKRIRFLTSNYYLFNKYRSTSIKTGIYYNYPHITETADGSGLKALDDYLRNLIFSENTQEKCLGRKLSLNTSQKRQIVSFSFVEGFKKKLFHRFSPFLMKKIKRCWGF
ncbi:antiviral reverse transcriptase Drt3a [Alteromonas sp. 009811495]|uniref:antiviral reverse transcriptase Drt3a n=1 Tax=Alteromonas sp. 009811495 TaxID=3002962 RepID=UPI00237D954D|nr:antiviral reverse transcriptase Drt3a [Alteromonas sp. 009811495]WDT85370.1 RNA-directed DNA polymerase [Alteromonas sp. 009811495]